MVANAAGFSAIGAQNRAFASLTDCPGLRRRFSSWAAGVGFPHGRTASVFLMGCRQATGVLQISPSIYAQFDSFRYKVLLK